MNRIYTEKSILANQKVAKRNSIGKNHSLWFVVIGFLCLFTVWIFWPGDDPDTNAAVLAQNQESEKEQPAQTETPEIVPVKTAEAPPIQQAIGKELDSPLEGREEVEPDAKSEIHKKHVEEFVGPTDLSREIKDKVLLGESLSLAFQRNDLSEKTAQQVVQALKKKYNFRHLKAGTKFEVKLNPKGELDGFTLFENPLETYYVRSEGDSYNGYKIVGETKMYVEQVAGRIEQSLAQSVWKLGESNALTSMIAEIFAWDIDFYSDVQKGDEWRVLVEKNYYNGKFISYGQILCARFTSKTLGTLDAYYFETSDKQRAEFFDAEGNAIRKNFLRAPLDTTRVTSKYGYRNHPVSGKYKKHNGVDYGAPRGTPIWSIAKGRVLKSGWMGSCGKGVKLRHSNGYESIYCHMSSIAVRRGQKVKQKTMLGRVGCTGSCTGPHLHFGMKKHGRYINPQSMKFMPGKKLQRKYRNKYRESRALLKSKLDKMEIPEFYGPALPPDFVASKTEEETKSSTVKKTSGKKKKSRKKVTNKGFRPRPEGIHEVKPKG